MYLAKLTVEDLHPNLLETFERMEETYQAWRKEYGEWRLVPVEYTTDWNETDKARVIEGFRDCIVTGGSVFGVFLDDELLGFASVHAPLFGQRRSYANLDMLHVTQPFRGKGLGKKLFQKACDAARSLGATHLYISAHSCEDSVAFYMKQGCTDAEEINSTLAEKEPYDRPLECKV